MSGPQHDIVIPDRQSFKAAEVCELLQVQPYVLRTWEQEFKELGVAKSGDGPRVYRRQDVELAVRIRQLVFGEGLTLAGARRRLESERPPAAEAGGETAEGAPGAVSDEGEPQRSGLGTEERVRLRGVRDELRTLLTELSSPSAPSHPAARRSPAARPPRQHESPVEPEGTTEIREFTLEPLDVEPHLVDEDARVVAIDAGKAKRKRRGDG